MRYSKCLLAAIESCAVGCAKPCFGQEECHSAGSSPKHVRETRQASSMLSSDSLHHVFVRQSYPNRAHQVPAMTISSILPSRHNLSTGMDILILLVLQLQVPINQALSISSREGMNDRFKRNPTSQKSTLEKATRGQVAGRLKPPKAR